MQDTHDERRIALEPQPESRSLLESIRFWLTFGQARRNKREGAQAKAAADNAPLREAEARRKAAQPGSEPYTGGFAAIAGLPVICLACVAILFALAVLS